MDPSSALLGHTPSMSCSFPSMAGPSARPAPPELLRRGTAAAVAAAPAVAAPLARGSPRPLSFADPAVALVTILPLSLEGSEWRSSASSPRQHSPRHDGHRVDPARIPLPASAAGSDRSSRNSDLERKVYAAAAAVPPLATQVPLPPSTAASEDGQLPAGHIPPTVPLDPSVGPECIPLPRSAPSSIRESLSQPPSRRSSLLSTGRLDEPVEPTAAAVPELNHPKVAPALFGAAPIPIAAEEEPEVASDPSFAETMALVQRTMNARARNVDLQEKLVQLLHTCGAHSRCLGAQSFLYRRLVECFRLDMKPAFVTLFEQMEAFTASYGSPAPKVSVRGRTLRSHPAWIETLEAHSRPMILKLLNNLRTNPVFLAERISSLTSAQLKTLAKPHLPSGREASTESSPSNRLDLRLLRPWSRSSSPGLDGLSQDPLRLMILGCFDASATRGSYERQRQLDVWSTASARLIEDQRLGSNEFCFAVLEIFADLAPWDLGSKLELYLLELMHTGSSVMSAGSGPASTTKDLRGVTPHDTEAINAFLDQAVESLLDLVISTAPFSVPVVALDLIHATLQKLSDSQRIARARRFFVYTWFCNTFLSSALIFPERHGILLNAHISPSIRQKIFRELASRFQRTVRDVLDPRTLNSPSAQTAAKVEQLVAIFEEKSAPPTAPSSAIPWERPFVVLFAEDVLSITKTLYPNDPSDAMDKPAASEPTSPPSSITGSSTLTVGTNDKRSGIASAFTPSVSGTSVTSHTLSSDFFLKSPNKLSAESLTPPASRSRPATSGSWSSLVEDIPVHTFLSELWKLCASRKSSASPPPMVETAMFFVDSKGHLDAHGSQNHDGELHVYSVPEDAALCDSLLSKDTQTIINALSQASADREFHLHTAVRSSPDTFASLTALFRLHLDRARCQHDFRGSFFWFHALRAISELPLRQQSSLAKDLAIRHAVAFQAYSVGSQQYQEWVHALEALSAAQLRALERLSTQSAALRTKMWYLTDVRHSDVYEHTVHVVKALKTMSQPQVPKQHGVAAWARQRLRVSFGHEKAQAQVLDLLSAPRSCGGPNKLTDDQAELTSRWLTRESIENFCGGEERVHRYCFEIQRCAGKLVGASMSDSPVLWSSPLFNTSAAANASPSSKFRGIGSAPRAGQHHDPASSGLFARNRGLGFAFDRDGQLSPGHATDPFVDKGSVRSGPWQQGFLPVGCTLPPTPVSPRSAGAMGNETFVSQLRQSVTALLVSDLGPDLWGSGTETDLWMNDERNSLSTVADALVADEPPAPIAPPIEACCGGVHDGDGLTFDFDEGYAKLIKIFKYSLDPQQKLQALYELSILAECQCISMSEQAATAADTDLPHSLVKLVGQARGVPRIRLTRLQEVVANCNERRQSSQQHDGSTDRAHLGLGAVTSSGRDVSSALALVSRLFLDPAYRPTTLFRDLQLIAAFVPGATLDQTPQGTVFWTVGLVAMGLKSAACALLTRRATAIVDYHVSRPSHRREPTRARDTCGPAAAEPPTAAPPLTADELAQTTLADAARFYLLSALEGEPAAARELALFHLTHPELVRPALLPLSRPGEVARAIALLGAPTGDRGSSGGSYGGGGGAGGASGMSSGVLDPPTFAVAYHWMEFAANAGDADALTFLAENRDLGKGL